MPDPASSPARPLAIAFVVDRFGARFGGAEAYGVALMRELSAAGHQVTVFAREYDAACGLDLPFRPIAVGRRWPSWIRVLLFARRAARATRSGFDIVHSHMNGWCGDVEVVHVTPVRYRWRVQPMSALRRMLSAVSPRVRAYLGLEARRVAPRPGHRVVAVSSLIAHQLSQAYGARMRVPVIPPGVSRPGAGLPDRRAAVRGELELDEDAHVCLLVARNPMRKGLPTVLQALERLPREVHLLVVGANAAARDRVREAPEAVRARVRLVGETSDVAPYYQAADCYVHPTLNDSFGMAPLEAMSFGLPVVLSPAPWCGFAQYVRPGEDALVISHPERPDELAEAIGRLRSDAGLRDTLAEGAQRLLERHAWPEVARQYQDLYAAILCEREAAQIQPRSQ
ncbi:glycosyltransferase family 4 protein [Castellaniella sp. S9]|uniref:glycosyltransferase family 4 protein n=1 Tax=Castellaniella sp. S9 TaxID=2993652 RepID=UPI0022B56B67|nr:glycosyltransferase family 4 protein [Castellaniella sp. S9]